MYLLGKLHTDMLRLVPGFLFLLLVFFSAGCASTSRISIAPGVDRSRPVNLRVVSSAQSMYSGSQFFAVSMQAECPNQVQACAEPRLSLVFEKGGMGEQFIETVPFAVEVDGQVFHWHDLDQATERSRVRSGVFLTVTLTPEVALLMAVRQDVKLLMGNTQFPISHGQRKAWRAFLDIS